MNRNDQPTVGVGRALTKQVLQRRTKWLLGRTGLP